MAPLHCITGVKVEAGPAQCRVHLRSAGGQVQRGNHGQTPPRPPSSYNNHTVALTNADGNNVQVGDTPADTIMGQAANLGLTIGVLTGVGAHRDLVDADIIVQVRLNKQS